MSENPFDDFRKAPGVDLSAINDLEDEVDGRFPDQQTVDNVVGWLVEHKDVWIEYPTESPDAPQIKPGKPLVDMRQVALITRIEDACNKALKEVGIIKPNVTLSVCRLGACIRLARQAIGIGN